MRLGDLDITLEVNGILETIAAFTARCFDRASRVVTHKGVSPFEGEKKTRQDAGVVVLAG